MPFDGITLAAIARELNHELTGARIHKIYQPEKDEICLVLRKANHENANLVISANPELARIHLAQVRKDNPKQAPAFCMLLRKYLEGAKLKEITQNGFERVLTLHIDALNDFREWEEKQLVFELMGKHSNLILLQPERQIIIDAIKRYTREVNAYRQIMPGSTYIAPPPQDKLNPMSMDPEDFFIRLYALDSSLTLAKSVFTVVAGCSLTTAKELCLNIGLDPEIPLSTCGEYELSRLWSTLRKWVTETPHGYVWRKQKTNLDFAAYPFQKIPAEIETYNMVNLACDAYFQERLNRETLLAAQNAIAKKIRQQLDRTYKKHFLQTGDQQKSQENKKYKIWGELLTAFAYQFKKGDREACLVNFYNDESVVIELDPRYTPIENAQRFFKIYNKSQAALKHLETLLCTTQNEIDYLESVLTSIIQSESLKEVAAIRQELIVEGYLKGKNDNKKNKLEKLPPRRFISSDGYNILVGRNNQQNDWLTLKAAAKNDLWLHTQNIPGSHVIIDLPQGTGQIEEIPDRTLEEAAQIAAYYSKARSGSKVPVDYTFQANVKKPPGAKPGMVIYNPYWSMLSTPVLELTEKTERLEKDEKD